MISRIYSAALLGIDAYLVEVEANLEGKMLPGFTTVGLPDIAVKESRERVQAAIKNSGYQFPIRKITINLAPADVRKEGSAYDLPIALGILSANGEISEGKLQDHVILGELALDGSVRPVHGALSVAWEAGQQGMKGMIIPEENADEAAMTNGLKVYPVKNLQETVQFLNNEIEIPARSVDLQKIFEESQSNLLDFSDVKGQAHVKRSLEVAAAGGHNLLMIGPPGSGKTMLAKRFATVLPKLTFAEALETTKIHSVCGLLPKNKALIANRPFRSPHHTISDAGLIGGGRIPRPGEVSLAHHGVLFLDELPEFKKNVLEVMRQPMEDNNVTISRALLSISYPANFMLVAAMNPCPCGYYTDPNKECSCTSQQIQKYLSRISGPLLDRIDIQVEVPAVRYKELSGKETGESSAIIRQRVQKAREIQLKRFEGLSHIYCNADIQAKELRKYCAIGDAGQALLKNAINRLGLSAG